MKISATLATAAALTFPNSAVALRRQETRVLEDSRELFTYVVVFDECVGLHVDECKQIIQDEVSLNPDIFENRASLNCEVEKVREGQDSNYYLVGLRTNVDETGVVGILGDGMVFYPWDWCTAEDCFNVGPWDCDVGTPLTVDQCCTFINASVPDVDVNGNYLDCYADPPVGSVSNPVDYGRVTIHVDGTGRVVHAPRNE